MKPLVSIMVAKLSLAAGKVCAAIGRAFRMLIGGQSNQYWPGRYYMRGPGPAWRAKHQRVSDPS